MAQRGDDLAATVASDLPSLSPTNGVSKPVVANPQANSSLFRLPAELRDAIYLYLFDLDCQTSGQLSSDGECHGPTIDLLNADHYAPSNALLSTCRIIYHEARNIFVQAQRHFWHKTIFTISLTDGDGVHDPVPMGHPEHLRNEQIQAISRIVINVDKFQSCKLYLTAELGSGRWSWRLSCVSDDAGWEEFIGEHLDVAREHALSPAKLRHTRDRLQIGYAQAKARAACLTRSSGDIERTTEAGERARESGESVVTFEQALQNPKRLELMFVIQFFCASLGTQWSQ